MKFSAAAVLAAVACVSAGATNVTYTTEIVDVYTTYCPMATKLTYAGKTYTITSATTLTITDCPCTVTKPVVATSSVVCHNCPAGGYTNSTLVSVAPTTPCTTSTGAAATKTATTVPTAGAGKVAALSGAGLAGIVGLAAFL